MSGELRIIDAAALPVQPLGREAPIYWGIWGLVVVEGVVFATLISSYFYLRLLAPEWPPAGEKDPELLLPTINTALLLLSSVFVHLADKGTRNGKLWMLKLGLAVGLALAFAFLVIKAIEFSHMEYRWDTHTYGSIFWTLVGFHTTHVIALVLKTIVVEVLAFKGFFHEEQSTGVQVNGLYWNFVVVMWLPIYATLYLSPRILD